MYNNLHKYKSVILFALKLLIMGGAYFFIVHKITSNPIFSNSNFLELLKKNLFGNFWIPLTIVSFTIVNWFLEIFKWKNLVSSFENISFNNAAKQSLASLTASLLTPNRIGEYGAKALYYNKNKRYKVLFLNFISNISQLTITVIFGLVGIVFLSKYISFTINVVWKIIFVTVLVFLFLFKLIPTKFWMPYWIKTKSNFKKISWVIHQKNMGISFLRYFVFSHQFYFLLLIFGINLDYATSMMLIFSMYLIASIIPGFVVFDWIIKGSVAISLFGLYNIPELIILSVTSLMWLLNFAIPALFGSYFVLTFKQKSPISVIPKSVKA